MMYGTRAVKGIILHKNKILLLEKKLKEDCFVWDLPGGLIEPYETEFDALKREIKEEVNIEVEVKEKIGVWSFMREYDNKLVTVTNYICIFNKLVFDIQLSDEHSSYKWIEPHEITNYKTKDDSLVENILKTFLLVH